LQFRFGGAGLFDFQVLGVRPYYQTDLRSDANIQGVSVLYEPYKAIPFHLGARAVVPGEPNLFAFYWRVMPEFNFFHVDNPGRTSYLPNRDYAYLGGTIQLRSVLFENMGPSWLNSRFYLNGSFTQFWDLAAKGKEVHDIEAEAGYIIAKDVPIEGLGRLTTSVSLLYNKGVSRLTNDERDLYRVQLNVRY
jgi:hypothetical protein